MRSKRRTAITECRSASTADGIDRLQSIRTKPSTKCWSQILPWFVKQNRRAASRHRYDRNNTRIGLEGSLTRQCQVLDLSRTGVRLKVTNAHDLPNTFTLILSENSSGRPARVKWRHGTEIGAEFLTANSTSASRLPADTPRAVKPRGDEGQKSESLTSTPSLPAQDRRQDAGELKPDARRIIGSISGDKTKVEGCCRITNLGGPIVPAGQKKDEKRAEALRQRINEWEKILGPEYPASFKALYDADLNCKDVQDILSIFAVLDQSYPE